VWSTVVVVCYSVVRSVCAMCANAVVGRWDREVLVLVRQKAKSCRSDRNVIGRTEEDCDHGDVDGA
jgi:hypothetical protein